MGLNTNEKTDAVLVFAFAVSQVTPNFVQVGSFLIYEMQLSSL